MTGSRMFIKWMKLFLPALLVIYFIPNTYFNRLAVNLYLNTNIGQQSLRNQLHAECYFTAQGIYLDHYANNTFYVDMNKMDNEVCWKQADHSLENIKRGLFNIGF